MNRFRTFGAILAVCLMVFSPLSGAKAASFGPVAIYQPTQSSAVDGYFGGAEMVIGLDREVPYRVFTLSEPDRLVLDFQEVVWADFDGEVFLSLDNVSGVRVGLFAPGWSRMVLDLSAPMMVDTAEMTREGHGALVRLELASADREAFDAAAGAPPGAIWDRPSEDVVPDADDGRLLIALDPGHGGIDPGAIRDGVVEKDIALLFAAELAEMIRRDGNFNVFLTRSDDRFVSLGDRVRLARSAGADLFLSIHANTVIEGNASGATLYTLSDIASDAAAEALAALENRADISAGLALETEVDAVARALIDLARVETNARSHRVAEHLVRDLGDAVGVLRTRPHRSAGFKVLKAPDIPSVMLELGYLSNDQDRADMQRADWRADAALAVLDAIRTWAAEDAFLAELILK